MSSPILEITGPHEGPALAGAIYRCRCTLCGRQDQVTLTVKDGVKGDIVGTLRALFERRPLPEAATVDELHLQTFAQQIAVHWHREMQSFGCKHCPMPAMVRVRA